MRRAEAHRRSRLAALGLAALLLALGPTHLAAQDTAPTADDLKSVEEKLAEERQRQERLSAEAKTLSSELDRVRRDLVRTARAAQEHEETLTGLETRLAALEADEARLKDALARRNDQTVRVLTALQRLAWRPSEALIAQPLTPNEAVRAAILLRTAVPRIKASVADLSERMHDLNVLKAEISTQRDRIAVVARELTTQRLKLEQLAIRKGDLRKDVEKQSARAADRVASLADEAKDLRDLMTKLAEERRRQAEERKKQLAAEAIKSIGPRPDGPDGRAPQTASLPAPPGGFTKAKGKLPMPARGRVIERYGEVNDVGLASKGISISTRSGAQVISPYDGVVVFSGPFRRYGQLLILEYGEGYHVLLAGMTRVDATVGQQLLAGEPVGVMGTAAKPRLYVEIRRDGQPINPLPWMVTQKDTDRG